jgi:hypothetical protein
MVLRDDPAVVKWLSYVDERGWSSDLAVLRDFLRYLKGRGFESHTPSALLEFQRKARREDREFELLDKLQEYLLQKSGTHKSLMLRHSKVRTFFKRNRIPLPEDDFKVKADREPVPDRLTVDVVRGVVSVADLGLKAFYLTLWSGLMDQERFNIFNQKFGYSLGRHVELKGVKEPFLCEFAGRKQSRNKTVFYTFIGRDALAAWREYFERIRGYPKEGEAALVSRYGRAYDKESLSRKHLRILERLNYVKLDGRRCGGYGYGLHNFRDAARTLLHLEGKRDGLDLDCVEYWMGHVTDPNRYDKFYRDKNYTLEQYHIAEKHLNIISGTQLVPTQDTKQIVEEIIKNPEACKILSEALGDLVGAKLAPVEQERKR